MDRQKIKIWLSTPHMGGKEQEFIREAFDKNQIMPLGDHINQFEQEIAGFLDGGKQVVALNTGTAALHMALLQLGIQAGDLVICQSMTFSASANPIVYAGAQPIFVDSEKDTWNMSPDWLKVAIEACIKKGKKPKAVVVVDLYGMPAQYDRLCEITQSYEIPLIEDAAEALGSTYKGRKCGTFGNSAILSFNGNKIITTSGGGALLCNSTQEADFARFLATQARDNAPHYQHSYIGFNYRMSNVAAGIGRGQMLVLADRIQARRNIQTYYQRAFSQTPEIYVHREPNEDYFSNYWLSCILIDPKQQDRINRETLREALLQEGIESRPLWKPMQLQPVFADCPFYGDGTSEQLFEQGLCLPSSSSLTNEELSSITQVVNAHIKGL